MDNRCMDLLEPSAGEARSPFVPDAVVIVSLNSPREKFWGVVLDLSPAGLSVRGIDLNSFDDFARQLKDSELVTPAAVFFPMQRIERIEIDTRSGEIPSLRERFQAKTGREFYEIVGSTAQPNIQVGCTLADARRRLIESTLAVLGNDLGRAAQLLDVDAEELRRELPRATSSHRQGA